MCEHHQLTALFRTYRYNSDTWRYFGPARRLLSGNAMLRETTTVRSGPELPTSQLDAHLGSHRAEHSTIVPATVTSGASAYDSCGGATCTKPQ